MNFNFPCHIVDQIIIPGTYTFYSFFNSDGKRWLVPQNNSKTALQLYQPSSFKGKLFKSLLPVIGSSKTVQKLFKISTSELDLNKDLKKRLFDIFGEKEIEFSVFMGTPSAHQKMTLQFFTGERILGYAKISDDTVVKSLFKKEKELLNDLNNKGLHNIPDGLLYDTLKQDIGLFVQSTKKSKDSSFIHVWQKRHEDFLKILHDKTKQTLNFSESDYAHTLNSLKDIIHLFPEKYEGLLKESIATVQGHYGEKQVEFSCYHGDFTPWNMFVESGELFVFDWEYAKRTYPPFMEQFHFFVQTRIFEDKKNSDVIFREYQKHLESFARFHPDPDLCFKAYLLEVIVLYKKREPERSQNKGVEETMEIWFDLLKKLQRDGQ